MRMHERIVAKQRTIRRRKRSEFAKLSLEMITMLAAICLFLFFQNVGISTFWYAGLLLLLFIRSGSVFKMAVVTLVLIPVLSITDFGDLSESLTAYTFLLLCVGIIRLCIEQWRDQHASGLWQDRSR